MLVVKIELWPSWGGEEAAEEIGRMYITNDGTSRDPKRGHYDVKVCRKGFFNYRHWDWITTTREGRVENYPRRSYNVWRLIARALKSCFPEER